MLVQAYSNSPNLILEGKVFAADDGSVAGGDRWGAVQFPIRSMKKQMNPFFASTGQQWKEQKLAKKPARFIVNTATQEIKEPHKELITNLPISKVVRSNSSSQSKLKFIAVVVVVVGSDLLIDIASIHGLGSLGFFIRPRFLVFSHYHLSVINFFFCKDNCLIILSGHMASSLAVTLIPKSRKLKRIYRPLQNELACAEHEKWPEICCSALTERINWLDVAISALKKDHADEIETGLLLHCKPAETLNEIVGDLGCASEIGNYAEYLGAPNEVLFVIDVNIIIPSRSKSGCCPKGYTMRSLF
ncbi:hypothetical protein HN51_022996 [Arachis hypogaea]